MMSSLATGLFNVYVSSSSIEGLPLACIEAMGAGTPVVLTECGVLPELAEHEETRLLVPFRNPQPLAASIQYLLEQPSVGARLGERARESVHMRFSLEAMIGRHEKLYLDPIRRFGWPDA